MNGNHDAQEQVPLPAEEFKEDTGSEDASASEGQPLEVSSSEPNSLRQRLAGALSTAAESTLARARELPNASADGISAAAGKAKAAGAAAGERLRDAMTKGAAGIAAAGAAASRTTASAAENTSQTLSRSRAAAAESLGNTREAVVGATSAAAASAAETVSSTLASVAAAGSTAGAAIRNAPSSFMAVFVRECSVPAFLLPTGSDPAAFRCVFRFDEVVERLTSGILVRPVIKIWTGRADFDRHHLATVLRDDFTIQLNAARERAMQKDRSHFDAEIERLKGKQISAGTDVEAAATLLASSALLMFFIANPLFNLLLLLTAVLSGTTGSVRLFSYVKSGLGIRSNRASAEREVKALMDELDAKNQAFEEAVSNLDVGVHPLLAELVRDYTEIDDRPYFPPVVEPDPFAPSVIEYLRSAEYRASLQPYYLPLLDLRTAGA